MLQRRNIARCGVIFFFGVCATFFGVFLRFTVADPTMYGGPLGTALVLLTPVFFSVNYTIVFIVWIALRRKRLIGKSPFLLVGSFFDGFFCASFLFLFLEHVFWGPLYTFMDALGMTGEGFINVVAVGLLELFILLSTVCASEGTFYLAYFWSSRTKAV